MAVSRNPGQHSSTTFSRLSQRLSWYDLLLAVLPLCFAVAYLVHLFGSLPLQPAIASGALLGLIVTVDALFVHPPTRKPPRSAQ
jgi:hypothetical protein